MLNIIFTFKATQEITHEFDKFNYVLIPEMREIDGYKCYQGNARSIEQITELKFILNQFGDCKIIGVWDIKSGLQYGYEYTPLSGTVIRKQIQLDDGSKKNIEIVYPFDIFAYKLHLNSIIKYDEEGMIISTKRPSIAQARNIQVNVWAGQPQRDLEKHDSRIN